MLEDLKKCPYCAEDIKREAVVCRFCSRDLVERSAVEQVNLVREHNSIGSEMRNTVNRGVSNF